MGAIPLNLASCPFFCAVPPEDERGDRYLHAFMELDLNASLGEDVPAGHRAGFVSIVGKPNVGKSTLLNAMVGTKLAAVTYKASTTRHRITGILNEPAMQAVFLDTPGVIAPKYALHRAMMSQFEQALSDSDVIVWVAAPAEKHDESDLIERLRQQAAPVLLVLNKMDLAEQADLEARLAQLREAVPVADALVISALKDVNIKGLPELIRSHLPESPPYFPKDQVSDQPERFFAAEIIREKVYLTYRQEVPYATTAVIEDFREEPAIVHINATVYVERNTQKGILVGKGGEMLKKVGVHARKDLEDMLGRQVNLKLEVRVADAWRQKERLLKSFGYRPGEG